jgi:L-threonylcarbamoyladenylate synthase
LSVLKIKELEKVLEKLKSGEPCAIPTETVYGLAASIDNPFAIRQIFALKERPIDHPLIIHASSIEMASHYAEFTEQAMAIGQRFWPGPLTLILPKKNTVPDEVTGGLPTVGVRIPNHSLTKELIEKYGVPLAAPSANKFGKTSPTCADHILIDHNHLVSVLDGGPCTVGVESTILDLTVSPPAIRRLGAIGEEDLHPFIPHFGQSFTPTSGTHKAHYAPSTALLLSDDLEQDRIRLESKGLSVAILSVTESKEYAQILYAKLRELDSLGVDVLIAEKPHEDVLGRAVLDRLTRASNGSPLKE